MRVVPRLVTLGEHGLVEPRDRLVELALLEKIRPDVVVGIAKLGIDGDRFPALGDRVVEAVEEAERPTEKRVRLGGRPTGDRLLVAADRRLEVARHVETVGLDEELMGAPQSIGRLFAHARPVA